MALASLALVRTALAKMALARAAPLIATLSWGVSALLVAVLLAVTLL